MKNRTIYADRSSRSREGLSGSVYRGIVEVGFGHETLSQVYSMVLKVRR